MLSALIPLALLAALCLPAFAARSGSAQAVEITGTLIWNDDENAGGQRPETVSVSLLADGEKVDELTVSPDWAFAFSVPLDSIGNTVYTVSAEAVSPYEEDRAAHVDPAFTFTYPSSAEWTKYEPCNELTIPDSVIGGTIIAGKMTANQPFTVWSSDALDEVERQLVWNSLKGIPGVGNPRELIFISGDGASVNGMTVNASEGTVLFEAPCNWALLFGGAYVRGTHNSLDSRIVFRPEETVPPISDEPPVDPEPIVDPEPVVDPEPTVDPEPVVDPEPDPGTILDPAPVVDPDPAVDPEPVTAPEPIVDPAPNVGPGSILDPPPVFSPDTGIDLPPVFGNDPIVDSEPVYDLTPDITPAPADEAEAPAGEATPVPQHTLDTQPRTGVPAAYTVFRIVAALSLLGLTVLYVIRRESSDAEE